MKLAIFSDIHGNYEAFAKVLQDIDQLNISKMISLGDCIGYGPESEQVIKTIRKRSILSIIGNHELALCDKRHMEWFNYLARNSLEKTRAMLSKTSLEFIKQMERSLVIAGCRCVHGFPPDSARTYLFQKSEYQIKKVLKKMDEQICFIGHTHDLEIVSFDGCHLERQQLNQGVTTLDIKLKYIINVGSVGQPRDGNNKAKYIIWDQDNCSIETRFIKYDIAATVKKIKAAGLPESHANRLW